MRIKCGDLDDLYGPGQQCRDCGVGTGEFHDPGCLVERCSQRHRYEDGTIQQAGACTGCYAEEDAAFNEIVANL